jgi:hypothetical protein
MWEHGRKDYRYNAHYLFLPYRVSPRHVVAAKRFASRADLGLGWRIAVLTGAGISCATLAYKALRNRTSVNLNIAAGMNYFVSLLCLFARHRSSRPLALAPHWMKFEQRPSGMCC